ncbi:MAG: cobyrinate a,c-diamide synthase [Gammaproteobacteria bacterium]
MSPRHCPALFISAPGSSHGKTTVTAALARFHTEKGRKVRIFKTGPDFLDPMILERACGHPVYQLDLWMAGKNDCRQLVYDAATDTDLILIEGVMGLFDGNPCSADLAEFLNVPVLAVIDSKGVAQTLGAIALGLTHYRKKLSFAGILANSIASKRHEEMVIEGFNKEISYLGGIPRDPKVSLPERHLGLVQADEVVDIDARLEKAAHAIAFTRLTELPPAIAFSCPNTEPLPQPLAGIRIGIARDAAFAFIYQANLDLLRTLGADLIFFSPLCDKTLPDVDSLYFPGGYPENYLEPLQQNWDLKKALKKHFSLQKPIYAECGGMLYMLESLTDKMGETGLMTGILPGSATIKSRIQGLGYQSASLPRGILRGHSFHHSVIESSLKEMTTGIRLYNTSPGEKIFLEKRLIASYLHLYFPSNPASATQLFRP